MKGMPGGMNCPPVGAVGIAKDGSLGNGDAAVKAPHCSRSCRQVWRKPSNCWSFVGMDIQ
jgi:hypothetical protein